MQESDNTILKKAANNDMQAFEMLVTRYEKLVYNIAYRMFLNTEDAKDMTQETFLKIFKNMHTCGDIQYLKSWVCKIATNTCIDELRKRKGKTTESLDIDIELKDGQVYKQLASDELSPEEMFVSQETWEYLQKAIYQLPSDYKTLIILRDIHGFSYNELSDITNSNIGTVKSRLSRARHKLKELYIKEQNLQDHVKHSEEVVK